MFSDYKYFLGFWVFSLDTDKFLSYSNDDLNRLTRKISVALCLKSAAYKKINLNSIVR